MSKKITSVTVLLPNFNPVELQMVDFLLEKKTLCCIAPAEFQSLVALKLVMA